MRLTVRHGLVLILVITACIYAFSLRNGFVNLDDPMLVTDNEHILTTSLANVGYVFTHFDPELYIPVTLLSYQIETWTLGPAAWHFHLFSIVLHLIAAMLVFKVVQRYSRSSLIAFITALLFAVHPINAEAVLWVSARKDILSSVFFLASLLCYFLLKEKPNMQRWYWLSILFFMIALMSKVTVLMLPVILILLAEKPKDIKSWMPRISPYLVIALLFGCIALAGKNAVEEQFHITDMVFMAFRSIFFYLSVLIAPSSLSAIHPLKPQDLYSPLLLLSVTSICFVSWICWRNRKKFPLICAGWIFFLVTLMPSFLHYTRGNEDFMLGSERYVYLPSIGMFLIAARLWTELWKRSQLTKRMRILLVTSSLIIILVLSYLTVLRTFVFQNAVTFNTDILQKYSDDGRTWYNLGSALEVVQLPQEAEEAYRKALKSKPDLANAAINLGILLLKKGQTEEGMTMLQHATIIRPEYFNGFFNLGVALQNDEKFSQAEEAYRRSIELFYEYPQAHRNLSVVLGAQKKFAEAMAELQILAELDPGFRAEFEQLKANIR